MKKRLSIIAIILGCILLINIPVTYSIHIFKTKGLENIFISSGNASFEIIEEFDKANKKDVRFKNTSEISSYIRVALVYNYRNKNDEVILYSPIIDKDYEIELNDVWFYKDGFYYYPEIIGPEKESEILIKKLVNLNDRYDLNVDVLIQSTRALDKDAVKKKWSVNIDENNKLVNPNS